MPSERNLWIQYSRDNLVKNGKKSFPFIPGLIFVALGLLVVLAPRLVITVIAAVLLLVGALMCFVAWKFIQLKKRFTSMTQEMDGKVQVHAFHVRSGRNEHDEVSTKKIIYH